MMQNKEDFEPQPEILSTISYIFLESFSRNDSLQYFYFCVSFQVSWIRKRDLHILTVGVLTYTSDQRFQVSTLYKSDIFRSKLKKNVPEMVLYRVVQF